MPWDATGQGMVAPGTLARAILHGLAKEEPEVPTIAFIGLGNMGAGMARRLLQAGHELRVFNRTRSKATGLEREGARYCSTPREACAGVDAVFAMTADD